MNVNQRQKENKSGRGCSGAKSISHLQNNLDCSSSLRSLCLSYLSRPSVSVILHSLRRIRNFLLVVNRKKLSIFILFPFLLCFLLFLTCPFFRSLFLTRTARQTQSGVESDLVVQNKEYLCIGNFSLGP
jgi:hypothetical protein